MLTNSKSSGMSNAETNCCFNHQINGQWFNKIADHERKSQWSYPCSWTVVRKRRMFLKQNSKNYQCWNQSRFQHFKPKAQIYWQKLLAFELSQKLEPFSLRNYKVPILALNHALGTNVYHFDCLRCSIPQHTLLQWHSMLNLVFHPLLLFTMMRLEIQYLCQ